MHKYINSFNSKGIHVLKAFLLCFICDISVDTQPLTSYHIVNSSLRGDAYMRQWFGSALVQIMAYRLFCDNPLSKPMLSYCHWTLTNKRQWSLNHNTKRFIHENAHENIVCEMAAILSRGRRVNLQWIRQWTRRYTPIEVIIKCNKWEAAYLKGPIRKNQDYVYVKWEYWSTM